MAQLRKNLWRNGIEPGKVHFRRWKAMSIGARISSIVLTLIVLIAALANFIAPMPLEIHCSSGSRCRVHLRHRR
ncbi:MAG: hypothetical protein ACLT98_09720 [Eggerthellaceae bacterium]